jgi:hypothetical protein
MELVLINAHCAGHRQIRPVHKISVAMPTYHSLSAADERLGDYAQIDETLNWLALLDPERSHRIHLCGPNRWHPNGDKRHDA